MREPKYRAWDKEHNFMYEVIGVAFKGSKIYAWRKAISGEFAMHIGRLVGKECDLMQFTGLIDIKGAEIFKNDLLIDDEGFIWKVIYKQGAYYAECADLMAEQLLSSVNLYSRVIGNIYQKPKLVRS